MSALFTWWLVISRVDADPGAIRGALRVSAAVTIPLAVTMALGHTDWAAYGVFGALSAVYGKRFGYADRLHAGLAMTGILTAAILLGVAVSLLAERSLAPVAAMALVSAGGALVSAWRGWLPVPSLFLVFACGTVAAAPHVAVDMLIAAGVAVAGGLFGVALGQVGRFLPPLSARTSPAAAPHPLAVRDVVGAPGVRRRLLLHLVAPLAAGVLAVALGLAHPAWACVAATVPLVAATLPHSALRAVHRAAGTAVGVVVAVALLSAAPPPWLLVAAVAVFQLLTELFVSRNYGLAVMAITPLALILTSLGSPTSLSSPLALGATRLLETTLGLAVALTLTVAAEMLRRPVTPAAG